MLFKLKHLQIIDKPNLDYLALMQELLGFNPKKFLHKVRLKKYLDLMNLMVEEFKNVDPKEIKENPDCPIKHPKDIGEITFAAMMELNVLVEKDIPAEDMMADFISIVCFSENVKKDFLYREEDYNRFKEEVLNSNVLDMLAIFNWIIDAVVASNKAWETLFFNVEVSDPDWDAAGGQKMSAFNVIQSIKAICKDLNVTYHQAWQIPHAVVQASNLATATASYIQSEMTKIKEQKMKSQRKSGR